MITIKSPLSVPISKNKKFILNLNNYRNAHYQTLNKAKKNYKAIISAQLQKLSKCEAIRVYYILYPKTKRRTDIGNVISIHKKFLEDALVEFKIIPDDDYDHVVYNSEAYGGVDKDDPRVDVIITEMTLYDEMA